MLGSLFKFVFDNPFKANKNKIEEINKLLKACLGRETASIQFSMDANKKIVCAVYLGIPGPISSDFSHEKRRHLFSEIMWEGKCEKSELITSNNVRESGNIIFTFSSLSECLPLIESDLKFYLSAMGKCSLLIESGLGFYLFVKSDESQISNRFNQSNTAAFIKGWRQSIVDMRNNQLWPIPLALQYEVKIAPNELKLFLENASVPSIVVKKVRFEEFAEFICLKKVSEIGVKTPEVERKKGSEAVYQFSHWTKITSQGTYECKSLFDYQLDEHSYVQANEGKILAGRKPDGTFSRAFEIDKISIARLLMAILLFGCPAGYNQNIGVIKSTKNKNEKYKLGLISFPYDEEINKIEPKRPNETLKGYLKRQIEKFSNEYCVGLLLPFLEAINDAEIVDGFRKIRGGFTITWEDMERLKECYQDVYSKEVDTDDYPEEYPMEEAKTLEAVYAHNLDVLSQAIAPPALIFSRHLQREREAEQNNPMQIEPNLGGEKTDISNNNRYFG